MGYVVCVLMMFLWGCVGYKVVSISRWWVCPRCMYVVGVCAIRWDSVSAV